MLQLRKQLCMAQLLMLLSFVFCFDVFALTPPGTVIVNRAEISYQVPDSAETIVLSSNESIILVGHIYSSIVENGSRIRVPAGVVAQFPHRIVNQGNSNDIYHFSFPGIDSDVFLTPLVYWDKNHNGVVDPGEPIIESTGVLISEQAIDIVVTTRMSQDLLDGQKYDFSFTSESENSDQSQEVTNTVTIGLPVNVDISLNSFPSCGATLFAGDVITHTIDLKKPRVGAIETGSYLVDGTNVEGILIELPLTQYTSFLEFGDNSTAASGGFDVIKLEGFADNEWVSGGELTDTALVKSSGFFLEADSLSFEQTAQFSVLHTVRSRVFSSNPIHSVAFYDSDNDGFSDVKSESTCINLGFVEAAAAANAAPTAGSGGELLFIEPNFDLRLSGESPDYSKDSDFVETSTYALKTEESDNYQIARDGMYLQLNLEFVDDAGIQTDEFGNRYVIVKIESETTGDSVNIVLVETESPGSFRSIAPIILSATERSNGGTCPAVVGSDVTASTIGLPASCVLQSANNDTLRGFFNDSETGFVVESSVTVALHSAVFDAQSLAPLPFVNLQFRVAGTNDVGISPFTGESYEYTTDSRGRYPLPKLADDVLYYLFVVPPVGYVFPSGTPPFELQAFNVTGFSYGFNGFVNRAPPEEAQNVDFVTVVLDDQSTSGVFSGRDLNTETDIDIPLDRGANGTELVIDKVATQTIIDIGQSLSYVVTVKNLAVDPLTEVVVNDTLPFGYRYVPGTTILDGELVADPTPSGDGDLVFDIGALDTDQSAVLSYSARATAAAVDSSGVNVAKAVGFTSSRRRSESMPAKATVTLQRGGVFSDKAALFGKIYVDQNCDGVQDHREWPIGGVRLYLQDGTYIISDADGQYSLYGLDPGEYVVKVDTYTLPEGLELKLLSPDQAADASSRFVSLSEGDFHRADFAAFCPKENTDKIFRDLKQRNRSIDGTWELSNAEKYTSLDDNRQVDPRSLVSTADGDLSNGILDGPKDFEIGGNAALAGGDYLDDEPEDIGLDLKGDMPDPKELVSTITEDQAKEGTWIWPEENRSINGRFMAVVRAGIDPTLYVNDEPVPTSKIGEQIINKREKAQIVAWYGVELEAGENTVMVKGQDSFGNERTLAEGVFKRPSSGAEIRLSAESTSVQADGGRTELPVTLEILDANGYPALGVYYVTLESSDGDWVEADIQDGEPGRQVRIENGERTLHFRPSATIGDVLLQASTGEFEGELSVRQISESRPLIVSGYIGADAHVTSSDIGSTAPSVDLGELDDSRIETRAALFVKGTVKDDYNLTLAYDSQKDRDQDLLRDINPALNYPIHGDASIRGFEAQSRSKLYARVERDNDSVMYGDFLTDPNADRNSLARISRTLTGFNSIVESEKNTFRVFAAREENSNLTEEIPGNGSALLYRVRQYPIVANSETVELITRSRENRGLIIESVRLSRLGDYTLDDQLGFLTFPGTIPTLDADQNPVFIRISYDIENGGEKHFVSGVRFDHAVNDKLLLGASLTHDGHDTEGKTLLGAHAEYKLGNKSRVALSAARSDSEERGEGGAYSMSFGHDWDFANGATTTLTHAHADDEFNNAGAAVAAGRTETTLQHTQQIKRNSRLLFDATNSSINTTDDNRRSVSAIVETNYKEWQFRTGLRRISQTAANESNDLLTSILGLRRRFSIFGKSGQANLEYEQDLSLASRKRIAVGAKLRLHEKVDAYANYDLTNSLLGFAGIGGDQISESFTLGVESKVLPSTKLYSEYRMRGAFESQEFESASGVRGDYEIEEGLRVSPQFEYIKRMDSGAEDSISASVGITDTRSPNSRKLLRLETRRANDSTHYGVRASMTTRLNNDWTAIVTDNYSRQLNDGLDTVTRHTFSAAAARRPKHDNSHHMLFMYRFRQDEGVIEDVDRAAHILSTHQNKQINESLTTSGRFGFKRDSSWFNSTNQVLDYAFLVDARLNYTFNRRFEFDLRAGALATNGVSEVRYSTGFGLNYTLNRNLRIGAAYNFFGFRDEHLDEEKYNANGLRVGVQYKLDEGSLKWLK